MIHHFGIGWKNGLTLYVSAQWDADDGDAVGLGFLFGFLLASVDLDDPSDFDVRWSCGPTRYVREVRGKAQRCGAVVISVHPHTFLHGGKMHRTRMRVIWRRLSNHYDVAWRRRAA